MPTLILTPRYTEDAQLLWRAAGRLGWNVERLRSWRVAEHLKELDWLVHLPAEFRKRSITLATLAEARKGSELAFIKPPNDKSFPARVYQPAELPTDYDEAMAYWSQKSCSGNSSSVVLFSIESFELCRSTPGSASCNATLTMKAQPRKLLRQKTLLMRSCEMIEWGFRGQLSSMWASSPVKGGQ